MRCWKLASKVVVSGGGERDFSHSLMKSDENLLMLLGLKLLSKAPGSSLSSPSLAWFCGEGDRSSALEGLRLLSWVLESCVPDSSGARAHLTGWPRSRRSSRGEMG